MKASWTVTYKDKKYELCEPSFEVMALAMQEYLSGDGKLNLVGAGKVVFDGCYIGKDIDEIQKEIYIYANICLKCARIVEFLEVDIKKN